MNSVLQKKRRGFALKEIKLEIGIHPDGVEIYEHGDEELTEEFLAKLREYGIKTEKIFASPCG